MYWIDNWEVKSSWFGGRGTVIKNHGLRIPKERLVEMYHNGA